jgi:hypothetical protein
LADRTIDDGELALARERLRIDNEPRLTLGGQHVLAVEVLIHENLLAPRRRELADEAERDVAEPVVGRLLHVLGPGLGLSHERQEPVPAPPETRQELDEHPDRVGR